MEVQYFKQSEAVEKKFDDCGEPILSILSLSKDEFFDQAFACYVLGELLYDTGRAPLANAMERAIFREAFATIFEAFLVAGSFESYLTVFRNIFGDDVTVEFTVSAPGKLAIEIEAAGIALHPLLERRVFENAYVYDGITDNLGEEIAARSPKGFETEYEAEQMLFEMVPAGIWTTISLTIA